MAVDRRALWLGGVVVVGVVAIIAVGSMNDTPAGPASAAARQRPPARRGADAAETGPVEVNLLALRRGRDEPDDGRNPFRFEPKAPPPVALKPLPPPVVSPGNQTSLAPIMPPRPVGPPPPPPITLKFLGIMGKKEDGKVVNIAVLSDGVRTYAAQEGKPVAGQYQVHKIGNESIEISYLDGRGRTTIRMSGDK